MGILDVLFGKKDKKDLKPGENPVAPLAAAVAAVAASSSAPSPEVVAAISASLGVVLRNDDDEIIAAITAAIMHAQCSTRALIIKRTSNQWANYGLTYNMNQRNFY